MSACTTTEIMLSEDAEQTRIEILKFIPLDTGILDARRIMESNKFECYFMADESFLDERNLNFLFCDLRRSEGLLIARRWQIAIVHKDSVVTDVLVSTGLIGP